MAVVTFQISVQVSSSPEKNNEIHALYERLVTALRAPAGTMVQFSSDLYLRQVLPLQFTIGLRESLD